MPEDSLLKHDPDAKVDVCFALLPTSLGFDYQFVEKATFSPQAMRAFLESPLMRGKTGLK